MLSEMLVLDTKDTPRTFVICPPIRPLMPLYPVMSNVFKIRHGKETLVYRTEISADKKILLSQFRHVAEELAAKKRKEREGENERRKSLWTAPDVSLVLINFSVASDLTYILQRNSHLFEKLPTMPDWMAELAQKAGAASGGSMEEKAEGDARWIGEFADELTVAIALREWNQAVTLIEEGDYIFSFSFTLALIPSHRGSKVVHHAHPCGKAYTTEGIPDFGSFVLAVVFEQPQDSGGRVDIVLAETRCRGCCTVNLLGCTYRGNTKTGENDSVRRRCRTLHQRLGCRHLYRD